MLILISFYYFPSRSVRYSACSVGGLLLLVGLAVLSWIDQDDGRHSFGHSGGTQSFLLPIKNLRKNSYSGKSDSSQKLLLIKVLSLSFSRIHMPLCSFAASHVHPHKCLLADKSRVSCWIRCFIFLRFNLILKNSIKVSCSNLDRRISYHFEFRVGILFHL